MDCLTRSDGCMDVCRVIGGSAVKKREMVGW